MYRLRWWIVGLAARILAIGMFRSVEVVGTAVHDGPRILVANHFGGLVDAIVVVRALGGLPHIVAKSTLFRRLPLRLALRLMGVVPVYRRADAADVSKNRSSFEEVAKVLAKGRTVLIFPEGTVTDTQRLQPIRTGAARMALTAMSEGTSNLAIVPIGITYEDKVSARSRVLVEMGPEIGEGDIADLAEGELIDENNHRLVRGLTDLIRERLGAVAPDFGSLLRERVMMLGAALHLRTAMTDPFAEPVMSDMREVAQRLGHLTEGGTAGDFPDTAGYQFALAASGLNDDQVQPPPSIGDLARVTVKKGLLVLILAPLALIGLVANLPALLGVVGVGALVKEPVTKGTARVVAGMVLFPLSWIVLLFGVMSQTSWPTGVALLGGVLLLIVGLVALIVGAQQLIELFEATITWWSVRSRASLLVPLHTLRTGAEQELRAALGNEVASGAEAVSEA